MWWVEGNLLFVEQTVPLRRATSHLLGAAHLLYEAAQLYNGGSPFIWSDTPFIWGGTLFMPNGLHRLALEIISFTAAGEKQSPTMLSERDTRGGTYRDFSTPLETRIQKETCRESRQVSYTPYGIR